MVIANKKAPKQTPKIPEGDTPEGARSNVSDAQSGRKVTQNFQLCKEMAKIPHKKTFCRNVQGVQCVQAVQLFTLLMPFTHSGNEH